VESCVIPSIFQQPQSSTITVGQSTTLSVGASGTMPLIYQWYRGTAGDASFPVGTISAALSVSPASTTSYWVRVSNACGTAESATATITVQAACVSPSITQHPQSSTITAGQSVTLSVAASGTSLAYQWYQGTAGVVTTPIGTNSPNISVSPGATTSCWVQVSNACGSVNSAAATVTVQAACVSPTITAHPQSTSVPSGQSVTLSVATSGTMPQTSQWFQRIGSGTPTVVGTGPTLTIIPTETSDFWVRVTNSCGTIESNIATVTVTTRRLRGGPARARTPQSRRVAIVEVPIERRTGCRPSAWTDQTELWPDRHDLSTKPECRSECREIFHADAGDRSLHVGFRCSTMYR
jgi:hypothetical protein